MDKQTFNDVTKLIYRIIPQGYIMFATVSAFDDEKRLMKVILEPSGIETGWCKVVQGAFSDKIDMEVIIGVISGGNAEQYVILGIIE